RPGLPQPPLVYGCRWAQFPPPPPGLYAPNSNTTKSPADRRLATQKQGLSFSRHGVHDQPSSNPKRTHCGVEDNSCAAADEYCIRLSEPHENLWRRVFDHMESWHSERSCITADTGRAFVTRLAGYGEPRGVSQQPFDRDRTGAGTHIPEQFTAPG